MRHSIYKTVEQQHIQLLSPLDIVFEWQFKHYNYFIYSYSLLHYKYNKLPPIICNTFEIFLIVCKLIIYGAVLLINNLLTVVS